MPEPFGYLDLERPNAARMYDYYLGGSSNVAADREAAEEVISVLPETIHIARANRSFLGRVVRYLAEVGVDQFLDLGSGIPTAGNVHEVARSINPDARVAYVDIEPVAVTYARELLDGDPLVSVTQEDIRKPDKVLAAPGVAELFDPERPVAVLAFAILHAIPDSDDPAGFLGRYREACAPGSYLGISHLSPLTFQDQVAATERVYARTPTPVVYRSRDEIAGLLEPYELVDPGLVLAPLWRPTSPVGEDEARRANIYGAVVRLTPPA